MSVVALNVGRLSRRPRQHVNGVRHITVRVAPCEPTVVGFGEECEVNLSAYAGPPLRYDPHATPPHHLIFCRFDALANTAEQMTMVAYAHQDFVAINGRCLWRRNVAVRVCDGDRVSLLVPPSATTFVLTVERGVAYCNAKSPCPPTCPTLSSYLTSSADDTSDSTPQETSWLDRNTGLDALESTTTVRTEEDAEAPPSSCLIGRLLGRKLEDSAAERDRVTKGDGTRQRAVGRGAAVGHELHIDSSSGRSAAPSSTPPTSSAARLLRVPTVTDDSCPSGEFFYSHTSRTIPTTSSSEVSGTLGTFHTLGDDVFYSGSFSREGDRLDEQLEQGDCQGETAVMRYALNSHAVTVHRETTYVATPVVEVSEPAPDDPLLNSITCVSFTFPGCLTPRGYGCANAISAEESLDTVHQCARAVVDALMFAYQARTNCFHYFAETDKQRLRRCSRRVVEHVAEMAPAVFCPVVRIATPLFCCSDVRGNFADVRKAYEEVCYLRHFSTQHTPILFLGNYVNKGDYSVEVVLFLLAWRLLRPNDVYLLRGSFEDRDVNGDEAFLRDACFRTQCQKFYYDPSKGDDMWDKMNVVLASLPIAAVIDESAFACHGGVPMLSIDPETEFPLPNPDRIAAEPHNGKVRTVRQHYQEDGLLPPVVAAADGTICADYFYHAIPTDDLFHSFLSAAPGSHVARSFLFQSLALHDGDGEAAAARRRLVREIVWNDLATDSSELMKPTFVRRPCADKWRLLEKDDASGGGSGPAQLRLSLLKYSALMPKGDSLAFFQQQGRCVATPPGSRDPSEAGTPGVDMDSTVFTQTTEADTDADTDDVAAAAHTTPDPLSLSSSASLTPLAPTPHSCVGPETLALIEATGATLPHAKKPNEMRVIRVSALRDGQNKHFLTYTQEVARASATAVAVRAVAAPVQQLWEATTTGPANHTDPSLEAPDLSTFSSTLCAETGWYVKEDASGGDNIYPWARRKDALPRLSSFSGNVSGGTSASRSVAGGAGVPAQDPVALTMKGDDVHGLHRLVRVLRQARAAAGLDSSHKSAGMQINTRGFCTGYSQGDHQGVVRQFTTAAASRFLDRFGFTLLLRGNTRSAGGVHVAGENRIVTVFTHSFHNTHDATCAGACLLYQGHIQLLAWRTPHRPLRACIYKDSMGCYMHERSLSVDDALLKETERDRRHRQADADSNDKTAAGHRLSPLEVVIDAREGFNIIVDPHKATGRNRHSSSSASAPEPRRAINWVCIGRDDDPRREQYQHLFAQEDARDALVAEARRERAALRNAMQVAVVALGADKADSIPDLANSR